MKNRRTTTAKRVKTRARIFAAALFLSLSGPVASDFVVPPVAEAQINPEFATWRLRGIYICLPWTCWGNFCCGFRI